MSIQPVSPDYQNNPLWRLLGATVTGLTLSAKGEIHLTTTRGDEFVFSAGNREVELYQIERTLK